MTRLHRAPGEDSNSGAVFEITGWSGSPLGFRFGNENREIFVNRDWPAILISLDGVVHEIKVTEAFWRTCPEVRDQAIEAWLLAHHLAPWPDGEPPRVKLRCLGGRRFEAIDPKYYNRAR